MGVHSAIKLLKTVPQFTTLPKPEWFTLVRKQNFRMVFFCGRKVWPTGGLRFFNLKEKVMPRLKFLCLALGLCCGSLPAFGAEIFVSQSGNNSTGNGTAQNPYRTITRGASQPPYQTSVVS